MIIDSTRESIIDQLGI